MFKYCAFLLQIALLQMEHNFDIVSIPEIECVIQMYVLSIMTEAAFKPSPLHAHRWIMPPVLSPIWWKHFLDLLLWWSMPFLSSWKRYGVTSAYACILYRWCPTDMLICFFKPIAASGDTVYWRSRAGTDCLGDVVKATQQSHSTGCKYCFFLLSSRSWSPQS